MSQRSRSLALAALVVAVLGGCAPTPTPDGADGRSTNTPDNAPGADLAGAKWAWVATQTPIELIVPSDPDRYTIEFGIDGTAAVLADCNRGRGPYTVTKDRGITVGPFALTRMACPDGSLDAEFLKELDAAAVYLFRGDTLYIDQKLDSGTMRFARRTP